MRTVAPPSLGERLAGRAKEAGQGLAALLSREPAATLGTAGFALFAAVVAANALTAQPGRHPQPLFSTRADEAGGTGERLPDPLVRTIQEGLKATGHYAGRVDGRSGPATEEAIRRFQGEWGLVPTGQPTPALAVAVSNAAAVSRTGSVDAGAPTREASLAARLGDDAVMSDAAEASGVAAPEAGPPSALADLPPEEVVRRIQAGLADARVAALKPDGIAGPATRRAIEAFQALDGMEVTGRADAELLQRLIDLGLAQ